MDRQSNVACVSSEEAAAVNQFLGTVFEPGDIVGVRFIETWTEDDKKKSKVKLRKWLRAEQLVQPDQWAYLQEQAEAQRANQFFGVCPRAGREHFDLACQVRIVRCLWADLDHCTPEEALRRCAAAGLPRPGDRRRRRYHTLDLGYSQSPGRIAHPPGVVRTEILLDRPGRR